MSFDRIEQLEARVAALTERGQEMLATIVKITNETPFPDEIKGWTEQRAKLIAEVGSLRASNAEAERERDALRTELRDVMLVRDHALLQVERLTGLIDMPRTDDFFVAVRAEAAHQIERWGTEHDAGKRAEDWVALVAYLLGKATKAHYDDSVEKLKHHVVTISAVCLNWLRNLNGESKAMRPGVASHPDDSICSSCGAVR